jgi:hypothetical protein
MERESKEVGVVQQRELNGLSYEMLPSTTVAVSRTMERQYFQKNTYSPNQEALCDMNTGAKFVNSRRSYLTFKVTYTASSSMTANYGKGSALNLIKRVVITTRSGVELCRTEDYNVLMAQVLRYGCSKEYVDQFGPLLGFGESWTGTTKEFRICIPLDLLSPFFRGDGKTLLPPQAAAGLRVQITWESAARAIVDTDGGDTSYEIDDISIMANTTTMVDAWQRALNQESASEGLTYSFPSWYTTVANLPANQSRINIEQRKAVARVLMAFSVLNSQADGLAVDNMKAENYTYAQVEWRLGSLYPTQQKITNAEEAYFIAQNSWDSVLDCKRPNSVSLAEFKTGGHGVCAVSLERNDVSINGVLNISGLSTNNSRVLAVDQQLTAAPATASKVYVFMKYLSMTKLFLDNASLSV